MVPKDAAAASWRDGCPLDTGTNTLPTTCAAQRDMIARARDIVVERACASMPPTSHRRRNAEIFLFFSDFLRIFWPPNSLLRASGMKRADLFV
ncbi:hypothetical protein VSR68_23045 [Paraburkholderia phymatum]|uniref:hypothetical protein n=1 Tax=Paraburkholderia phymatum TaxID=148447 RepID=UPI00317568C6